MSQVATALVFILAAAAVLATFGPAVTTALSILSRIVLRPRGSKDAGGEARRRSPIFQPWGRR